MKQIATVALFPIESTQLALAGYNPEAQTLAISFKGGDRVYHYHGVSPDLYDEFQAAKSKGAFFYSRINNRFPFDRIEADGTVSKTWEPPKEAEAA